MITEVELLKNRGSIGKVRVTGRVDRQIACEGEFIFALVERDDMESVEERDETITESDRTLVAK
jgi:hypothetical protein